MAIDFDDESFKSALAEVIGESAAGVDLDDCDPQDFFTEFSGIQVDIDGLLKSSETSFKNLLEDLALGITVPRNGHGDPVAIGFDTEYVTDSEAGQHRVLSYQFHLLARDGEYSKVFYPSSGDPSHRLRLDRMLHQVVKDAIETGTIDEFPRLINLCGFFLRLDLGTLADFTEFKRKLSNIGGRLGTLKDNVALDGGVSFLSNIPDKKQYVIEDDGFPRKMIVRFLDVGSHTPEGMNLAAIGQSLKLPKLTLPEGHSIERMDELLADNKPAFEAYGIRDAEIAAHFFQKLKALALDIAKTKDLPSTASGHGVALFRNTLKDSGMDFNEVFGLEDHTPILYDEQTGHTRKGAVEKVRINRRDMYEHFITRCYHGGRNECFMAGPTEIGLFNDYDLAGAYTTGMVDFPLIDFDRPARISHDPHDYCGHVIGFAHVRFQFPEETRYPSLPVESEAHGLIYPMSGLSFCTAPEIEVALGQGCLIDILDGVIYEQKADTTRVFEPFVMTIRDLRARFPKGSLWEKYVKLVGNGLYGKTAQGLKEKRVFEAGSLKHVTLPHSSITFAACAAHVTGFVRAVMSELLHRIPLHRTVVSVTTDGFLTDANFEELCVNGPMAQRFNELCLRVAPDKPMLECKHQGQQILAMKTRGQLTASAFEDKPIILAKGSVSPPIKPAARMSPDQFKSEQNDYMVALFLNRQPGQKTEIRPFVSMRDQMTHDKDVVRLARSISLNLEYDFKRRPVNPVVRTVAGVEHLAFDSVPWAQAAEVDLARVVFDVWRKRRCLKKMVDWTDWQDYYKSALTLKTVRSKGVRVINMTSEGSVGLLKRMFLRAYTRGMWGLQKTKSYSELATWLTGIGCETTVDDIKNASRSKAVPAENCVPRTPETEALVIKLQAAFSELETDRLFEVSLSA